MSNINALIRKADAEYLRLTGQSPKKKPAPPPKKKSPTKGKGR
jgi:hypothetical protein